MSGLVGAQRPLYCHHVGMTTCRGLALCSIHTRLHSSGQNWVQPCRQLNIAAGTCCLGMSQQWGLSELHSMIDSHSAARRSRSCVSIQCVQALERPPATTSDASTPGTSTSRGPSTSMHGPATWMDDITLRRYDQRLGKVELVVAGAGPSGLAVAERVSKAGQFVQLCHLLPLSRGEAICLRGCNLSTLTYSWLWICVRRL